MGFDLLQKDPTLFIEGLKQYAKMHHQGEIEEDSAAKLEEYMSQHHTGEMHDIQSLQKHLTEAKILTEPHAPIHDMLHQSHLIVREVPADDYRHGHAPTAHELLQKEHEAQSEHLKKEIEKDFA